MTTIVSRLYADSKTAQQAVTALKLQNHPDDLIDMIDSGSGAEQKMLDARVPEESAAQYAKAMKSGNTLVVYRAPVTPFGAARNAMDTLDEFESLDAGVENQNYYLREDYAENPFMDLKIDRSHSHWASSGVDEIRRRGRISDAFGLKMVYSGKKYFGTTSESHFKSGRKFWGTFSGSPIDSGRKFWGTFAGEPVLRGTHHFGAFLVPLISRAGPYSTVIRKGGYADVS